MYDSSLFGVTCRTHPPQRFRATSSCGSVALGSNTPPTPHPPPSVQRHLHSLYKRRPGLLRPGPPPPPRSVCVSGASSSSAQADCVEIFVATDACCFGATSGWSCRRARTSGGHRKGHDRRGSRRQVGATRDAKRKTRTRNTTRYRGARRGSQDRAAVFIVLGTDQVIDEDSP